MNENAPEISGAEAPEETKKPLYTCEYTMDMNFFAEFADSSYIIAKKLIIIFTVLNILYCLLNIFGGSYTSAAEYSSIVSFLIFVLYFSTKKGASLTYKRNLFSYGNETRTTSAFYDDKILATFGKNEKEFFYHQVSGFFETGSLILLRLKYNMFLALDKSALNADPQVVKAFLIQKCPMVKKKKFTDCSNNHRLSFIFLMISLATAAAAIIVWLLSLNGGI